MAKKSSSIKKTSGRTWLLLRGLARGQGHWAEFPQKLKAQFPHDEIVFLDLPGNGNEFRETSPLRIQGYVEFLRSRLKEKHNPGNELHVIAVSLAAMVVIEWMKLYPKEIHQAHLINTSLKGSGTLYERLRPENYLNLVKILGIKCALDREKMILKMTTRNLKTQDEWVNRFAEYSADHPVTSQNFLCQLTAAAQSRVTDTPPGSVQILVSSQDNFVNPKCSFKLAEKWGLVPRVHVWAGHDLSFDDPDWVLEQLD